MIANLPMYDRASNVAAHDAFWALIRDGLRDRGIAAPAKLSRDVAFDAAWARDDLVISQICNMPYRVQFRGRVTLIGASDYGLPHCGPGQYRSAIVVRRDAAAADMNAALRGRFATNAILSHSGFGAPWIVAKMFGFALKPALITGAHSESLAAVAQGKADCAALDAQTWRILQTEDPHAAAVRVAGYTPPSPGITYVTKAGQDPAPYFAAIRDAIAGLSAGDRETLGLRSIVALADTAYDLPIPDLAHVAA